MLNITVYWRCFKVYRTESEKRSL